MEYLRFTHAVPVETGGVGVEGVIETGGFEAGVVVTGVVVRTTESDDIDVSWVMTGSARPPRVPIQIPPPVFTMTIFLPSAEMAAPFKYHFGKIFDCQVSPPSIEVTA